MNENLLQKIPDGIAQVLLVLKENEMSYKLCVFDEPAHHADQAAALVGCELGAVVKSLVLKTEGTQPIITLVSGMNRVDLQRVEKILGMQAKIAAPEFVLRRTGYPVGTVPPFGFEEDYFVIIDTDLMDHPYLWASAGNIHTLMQIRSKDLASITHGYVSAIH